MKRRTKNNNRCAIRKKTKDNGNAQRDTCMHTARDARKYKRDSVRGVPFVTSQLVRCFLGKERRNNNLPTRSDGKLLNFIFSVQYSNGPLGGAMRGGGLET